MTWARKRQVLAILTLLVLVCLVVGGIAAYVLHTPASCIDNKQNQDETGIDCGGVCSTVCRSDAQAPRVRFVRLLAQAPGRTDLIAYIDNPNTAAEARSAQMQLDLYGEGSQLISHGIVPISLPAHSTVPIFLSNIGTQDVSRAFLSFASGTPLWTRPVQQVIVPRVRDIALAGTTEAPRVTATLVNPIAYPLHGVTVIATIFNASGTAIAATQTYVPDLAPQGSASMIFTFSAPFAESAARVEVLPVPMF